jgi:outer membrane biosynthesis protein TonB
LNDFIHLVEKYTGKKAVIKQLPDQPGDVPYTCADVRKAEKLLGYKSSVSFEEGIKRTVEWYQQAYPENVKKIDVEPAKKVDAVPEPGPEPAPKAAPKAAPKPAPKPVPKPAPKPKPKPKPKPAPKPAPKPVEKKADPVPQPAPKAAPIPGPEPQYVPVKIVENYTVSLKPKGFPLFTSGRTTVSPFCCRDLIRFN